MLLLLLFCFVGVCFFFFNDTATTEIYTLSLHDALPIFLSTPVFCTGTFAMGFGGGWFGVGTLVAAMDLADAESSGLAVGAWGAVQEIGRAHV